MQGILLQFVYDVVKCRIQTGQMTKKWFWLPKWDRLDNEKEYYSKLEIIEESTMTPNQEQVLNKLRRQVQENLIAVRMWNNMVELLSHTIKSLELRSSMECTLLRVDAVEYFPRPGTQRHSWGHACQPNFKAFPKFEAAPPFSTVELNKQAILIRIYLLIQLVVHKKYWIRDHLKHERALDQMDVKNRPRWNHTAHKEHLLSCTELMDGEWIIEQSHGKKGNSPR